MLGGEGARRPGERATWWLVFALSTLAISAWSLAVPLMTGPDEPAHAVRAAAVARGQLVGEHIPESHNFFVNVRVPAGYEDGGRAGGCFLGEPYVPIYGSAQQRVATCPTVRGLDSEVDVGTYQHRGQPFYYGVVGVPSLIFTGQTGLYLMRLIAALVCAALLASAVVSTLHLPDPRFAGVATLTALTPAALYLAGVINTSGLEIFASIAAWAAAVALVVPATSPTGRQVARAGVALSVLVLARGLGPGFALVVLVTCVLLADPDRRRELARRADVRAWLAVGAAVCAVSGAWLFYIHHSYPLPERVGAGIAHSVGEVPWWARSLVAVFGSTDVVPPVGLPVLWGLVVVAVLGFSFAHGRRRDVLVPLALMAGAVVMLITGEGWSIPQTGYWWQGRYVFPLFAGGLIVAGGVAGRRGPAHRVHADALRSQDVLSRPSLVLVVATLITCHVWAFAYALRHYGVGFDGTTNPLEFLVDPIWSPPPGPPMLWLALLVIGIVGLFMRVVRVARVMPRPLTPASVPPGSGGDGHETAARQPLAASTPEGTAR